MATIGRLSSGAAIDALLNAMTLEHPIYKDAAEKLEREAGATLHLWTFYEARYREALACVARGPIELRQTPEEFKLS